MCGVESFLQKMTYAKGHARDKVSVSRAILQIRAGREQKTLTVWEGVPHVAKLRESCQTMGDCNCWPSGLPNRPCSLLGDFVVPLISERPLFDCLTSVSGRWLAFASWVTAQGLEKTLHDALALLHMCYLSEEQAPNNIFIQEGKRHMTSLKPLWTLELSPVQLSSHRSTDSELGNYTHTWE